MSGNVTKTFGSLGSEDGNLDGPKGIAFGSDFSPYVVDANNDRALANRNLGTFVDNFDPRLVLDKPHGITILPNGRIYVADTGNDRVVQYYDEYAQRGPSVDLRKSKIRSNKPRQRFVIRGQAIAASGTRLHSLIYEIQTSRKRVRKRTIALPATNVANFRAVVRLGRYDREKKVAIARFKAVDLLGQTASFVDRASTAYIIRRPKQGPR